MNNKELEEKIQKLETEIRDIKTQVYKNNFSATQTFNKACVFSDGLRVPSFSVAPTVAELNSIMAISGTLYICTSISPVTWTVVGTQT